MANDEWWIFKHIKEYASTHGLDLSNLVAELDAVVDLDRQSSNVVEFRSNDVVNLATWPDGTFSLTLASRGIEPLRCHTVILQAEEPCLAVLFELS